MGMAGGIGSIGSMAAGAIPLPGLTESIQRYVLAKIGVLDEETGLESPLPSGNPNLIKEAKRRKTIGFSEAGSGLKCTVSVKMNCEWEQKFISGIDPTIVWQDIIATILRFGTSHSDSYGLSKQFVKTIGKWIANPGLMMENLMTWISAALSQAKDAVVATLKSAANAAGSLAETAGTTKTPEQIKADNANIKNEAIKKADETGQKIMDVSMKVLKTQIQKYKIEIEGIGRALSGAPSTPWHITLGNPLRPIFCAGDMYMESDVKLTFGPTLAFNDLPSNIMAEFTLTNARPWGLQEIMAKFNAGSIRVSAGIKSADATNGNEKVGDVKVSGGITTAGASASKISGTPSVTGNSQATPNITSAALQKTEIGPMTEAQVAQATAQTATVASVPNFANNYGMTSNLPPAIPSVSDLKPVSTVLPAGLTTTGIANISVSGLSGLSTTKEGKSGEQIVADANSTLATAQEVVSKLPTFGLS
jgi:hypothetical protein